MTDRTIPTPAPADRPSFGILVGGSAVSPEYQVRGVVVSRELNRIASAEIFIHDGDPAAEDFRVSNSEDFVPGAEVEIQAGYHGQDETLFKGVVVRHEVRYTRTHGSMLRVECRDAAMKLTVGRKSACFYDQKDSAIIEEIASSAGLDVDVEATDVTHAQMVQFHATDWDFVLTRAEANGKAIVTQDGKLVVRAPDASGAAALSLRFGGNLLEFEASIDARTQYSAVTGSSFSPADQAMLEVEGQGTGTAPGNLTSSALASVVDLDTLTLKHGGCTTDQELQAWANAEGMRSAFARVRGRARIQGFAGVAPGDAIELAGVGQRFGGKILVSGVRHEITLRNWETDLALGLSPESFGCSERTITEAPASGLLPGVYGLHVGIVTALEGDPDGEERIRVAVPMIDPDAEGTWARLATLYATADHGTVFRPEVGEEVVLGFLNGDPRNPVALGQVHSSAKPSPIPASDDNHEKAIVTRSGLEIRLDDDVKLLRLKTPNANALTLSDEDGGIVMEDENGNKIILDGGGITLESASDLSLKASGDVKIEGNNVEATAQASFKADGSGGAEVTSSASTTIKGSVVQIN